MCAMMESLGHHGTKRAWLCYFAIINELGCGFDVRSLECQAIRHHITVACLHLYVFWVYLSMLQQSHTMYHEVVSYCSCG